MANEPSKVQKGVNDVGAALGLVLTAIQTYAAAKAAWKAAHPGQDPADAGFPPDSEIIRLLGLESGELQAEAVKLKERYPSIPWSEDAAAASSEEQPGRETRPIRPAD